MRRRIILTTAVAIALIATLAMTGLALVEAGPFRRSPDEPTLSEQPTQSPAARDLGPVIATVEGLGDMHGGDLQETLGKDWHEDILQNVVDDRIVELEAASLGLDVTEDEISGSVDRLRGYFAGPEEFEAWLQEGQMDEAELRDRVRLQVLTARVFESVTGDVTVSAEEARTWFGNHPAKYPGMDGTGVPFYTVKEQVREDILLRKREEAYAAWLDVQREMVEVVVLVDRWWEEVR
jgi:hypothetical protein